MWSYAGDEFLQTKLKTCPWNKIDNLDFLQLKYSANMILNMWKDQSQSYKEHFIFRNKKTSETKKWRKEIWTLSQKRSRGVK